MSLPMTSALLIKSDLFDNFEFNDLNVKLFLPQLIHSTFLIKMDMNLYNTDLTPNLIFLI